MLERDHRVYMLMKERIGAFENGSLHLGALVADLESLENSLEAVGKQWRKAFHEEWWTLEQVYAVALDRNEEPLSDSSQQIIREALNNAKQLLTQAEMQ